MYVFEQHYPIFADTAMVSLALSLMGYQSLPYRIPVPEKRD